MDELQMPQIQMLLQDKRVKDEIAFIDRQMSKKKNQLLLQWAKDRLQDFETMGISLEIIDHTKEIEEKKLQDPVQVVFFTRKECIGEIRVWMSGIADMEILNSEGENIYYRHYDTIKGENFETISREFFQNLCE